MALKRRDFRLMPVLALGIWLGGCDCNCDEPEPLESGDYVISEQTYGMPDPDNEWLLGARLHIDREADIATIRYTREGTTYEARFTLEQ